MNVAGISAMALFGGLACVIAARRIAVRRGREALSRLDEINRLLEGILSGLIEKNVLIIPSAPRGKGKEYRIVLQFLDRNESFFLALEPGISCRMTSRRSERSLSFRSSDLRNDWFVSSKVRTFLLAARRLPEEYFPFGNKGLPAGILRSTD